MMTTSDSVVTQQQKQLRSKPVTAADAITRRACLERLKKEQLEQQQSATTKPILTGRGSVSGWTSCPFCSIKKKSQKRFALGRGIAAHLHAVHTPWKLQNKNKNNTKSNSSSTASSTSSSVVEQQNSKRKTMENGAVLGVKRQKVTLRDNDDKNNHQDDDVRQRDHDDDKNNQQQTADDDDDDEIKVVNPEKEQQQQQQQSSPVVVVAVECNNNDDDGGAVGVGDEDNNDATVENQSQQIPTLQQKEEWDAHVLRIVQDLEEKALEIQQQQQSQSPSNNNSKLEIVPAGRNRDGSHTKQYKDSLPPFLQAAKDGHLDKLKQFVKQALEKVTDTVSISSSSAILELLNTRDRHLSIAEHWAAGSGHLECLTYLVELRVQHTNGWSNRENDNTNNNSNNTTKSKKIRRRDGKTSLHYAARNGQVECINYLLQQQQTINVDEESGDGTTPLQLACFGGHLEAVKKLVLQYGANVLKANEWGCTAAHWVAMTQCTSQSDCLALCNFVHEQSRKLKQQQQQQIQQQQQPDGSDTTNSSSGSANNNNKDNTTISLFVQQQKQGHTALHKAAQRRNRIIIEWMAGSRCMDDDTVTVERQVKEGFGAGLSPLELQLAGLPDQGGHRPSDIWLSSGGDTAFSNWMREKLNW